MKKLSKSRVLIWSFLLAILLLTLLIIPRPSLAEETGNISAFKSFLNTIANYLKGAIIAAAAFTSALGAFFYITSSGDPKKIGKAKEYFYSAVTALIALVIAYLFFQQK